MNENRTLTPEQKQELIEVLKARFEKNMKWHKGLAWSDVQAKLEADKGGLWSLQEMERTGGEPDVVGQDTKTGKYLFYDCSAETPAGRRSLCYDQAGWESRKEARPAGNVVDIAAEMGIELLMEEEYQYLQTLGDFDTKTSSWLKTPEAVRKVGGGIFGDRRYGRVFVYHNGPQSYYAGRGFRGVLKV